MRWALTRGVQAFTPQMTVRRLDMLFVFFSASRRDVCEFYGEANSSLLKTDPCRHALVKGESASILAYFCNTQVILLQHSLVNDVITGKV